MTRTGFGLMQRHRSILFTWLLIGSLHEQWASAQDSATTPAVKSSLNDQQAAAPNAKAPAELTPYKVLIAVTFAESPSLDARFQQSVLNELRVIADRSIGPMWDSSIEIADWLIPRNRRSVERLTAVQIKERCNPREFDKCYPVAIELNGTRYDIAAREWDRDSEIFSDVSSRQTLDRRLVATEVFRVLQRLFRPVIHVDEGDAVVAHMRVRAGEFWPGDPAFSQVTDGSLFLPFSRLFNKDKSLRGIQFVPWCYLTAETVTRSHVDCRVDTGVRIKFAKRRRSEWRGLALRPTLPATKLTIVPQRSAAKPLVGYLVAVYEEQPQPVDEKKADSGKPAAAESAVAPPEPKKLLLRTDRDGQVTVPVKPEKPLQWVYIRSGREVLTRFPIVPGAEPLMVAQCPDDSVRLDVEGQIALLETELIDTIAKRAVTLAMIKYRSKKGEWARVDQYFADIAKLPKLKEFEKRVTDIQYPAIKKAEAKKSKVTVDRIKKLGAKVLEIAAFHLDDEKVTDLKQETDELRKIDKQALELERTSTPPATGST